ncbi:efflux RND transporter permease subunit [Dokdonella sp.]|uniref:efflux RND transporter permease subunit n=1 Tax=Dokdonella sp. TaxID=2291710 RepID=UPI0035277DEA
MNIVEFATRRRVTIGMTTLTLVLFGLIALSGLKVNLLPDLSYPTLTVRTEYEGAAPIEIENLISQPVEEALGVVKNVRKIHSVSRTGQSDVILEFAWGTDMEQASLETRDKLDILSLPLEAKNPVLLRFNPSTDPIIRLGLSGSASEGGFNEAELKQLRRFADDELKKRLEPVAGVAAVKVGGGLEDEISVALDQQKLAQLNLNVSDIVERLRSENVNVSAGRIEEGSQRYLVRTINQFSNLDQMRDMLVKVDNGVPIRLKDIAVVSQAYKEREGIVRIDAHEAIELAIYKEGDGNTVAVAQAVHKALERLEKTLPPGAKLTTIDDQSIFIQHSLDEVRNDALLGGTLAVLMIFFFLGHARSTFIISLSLPISLIATFFFMGQADLSLNVMSLGGLALATGMVVDDSIVVLENIARLRDQGMPVLDATVKGASEVSMAVTASTLTTVAVFFPLVFVEGVAGQLFRDQSLTITFAMLISLVVAMTLIPMMASLQGRSPLAYPDEPERGAKPLPRNKVLRFFKRGLNGIGEGLFQILPRAIVALVRLLAIAFDRTIGAVLRWIGRRVVGTYDRSARIYHRMLPGAMNRPWLVLAAAALAFAGSLALIPGLGMDLIPSLAQGRFETTIKLPPGTPLAETDALVAQIERQHARDPNIATIYGVAGTGTRLDATPTESGENIARLMVTLKPGSGDKEEAAAMESLRTSLGARPDIEVKFARPSLFSFSTPLEVEIRGYDLDALTSAGKKLGGLLEKSDRFTDIKSTVEDGYPEVQIRFDQDRAAALGLTTRQVSDAVVGKVRGEVATRYSFRDRKIDVLARVRETDRASVEDIRNLIVNPGTERPIRLSAVAEITATEGPSEIHRVDQERVAIISAGLRHGDLGSAVKEVRNLLATTPLAAGVSVHIGGQGEEMDASTRSMLFAFGLAIFLVYLVMASQFESLVHPFVIMFSIPLALVGAVLALKLTGTPISVVVFIGLIMLAGIVVKNAIVLIDRVNQLREEGHAKREAIILAAESRLRPIAMTTLATLLGFLPLAIGLGEGSEVRSPMAITVIGGLAVSTLLTLIVIPIVYELIDRKPDSYYVERGERKARGIEAESPPDPADSGLAEAHS